MSSKKKQKVQLRRMNWDVEYYKDLISGNGFTITEPAEVKTDEGVTKCLYGSQSPLYGTTYSDEHAFIERYRCKCGSFTSRQFEGETCPFCGTKVEYRDSNIKITGWYNLGVNKIINPYYYMLFTEILDKKNKRVFGDIINVRSKITTNGIKEKPTEEDYESPPTSPYAGIGIDAFYNNYENILTYFQSIKKNKADVLENLKKEKASVFTTHIPIYSTLLRPQSTTSDTFYYGSIDKEISSKATRSSSFAPVRLNRLVTCTNSSILFHLRDFILMGELIAYDALHREESCGGHFREEHQTEEGEAKRDDEKFFYVGCWEYQGNDETAPVLYKEPLEYEIIKVQTRNYKN